MKQNNYVKNSSNAPENFYILATNLKRSITIFMVQQNYFHIYF